MPKASAGEAGSGCDDASRRHQHCCKNAFHDRIPHFAPPLDVLHVIIPGQRPFDLACFALTPLALIRTSNRATDEFGSWDRGEQNRCMARLIVRRDGGRPANSKPAAKRMPDLEPRTETLACPRNCQ